MMEVLIFVLFLLCKLFLIGYTILWLFFSDTKIKDYMSSDIVAVIVLYCIIMKILSH